MKKIRPYNSATRAYYVLAGRNSGHMPIKAQILSVGYDPQHQIAITFAVNPDAEKTSERTFYVVAQGERLPVGAGELLHIGTACLPGQEPWHVFEVDSPEDMTRPGMRRGTGTVVNEHSGPVSGLLAQIGSVRVGGVAPGVYVQ